MSVLALIPARGGSQGIPRKNLCVVAGRPLVCWSIDAALSAASVDRVIVSTDDEEIAETSRQAGAQVPFMRPDSIAGHDVPDLPVFDHALSWLDRSEGYRPELVVHLRPTSPARPPGLIDQAVNHLRADPGATSLRSVSPAPASPWKMWSLADGNRLWPILGTIEEERFNQPRQLLPAAWIHNGVIDVIRASVIHQGSMSGSHISAFVMSEDAGLDIDEPGDLAKADTALRSAGTQ